MKDKLQLILLRGLPGSGKSTQAKKLEDKGFVHVENDMYFMKNGRYEFDINQAKDAANWCYDYADRCLKDGDNVVVSNVFVTVRSIKRYADLAKKHNADFKVFRMIGNFKNVHDVPEKVFNSMKSGFQNYPGEELVDPA